MYLGGSITVRLESSQVVSVVCGAVARSFTLSSLLPALHDGV